MCARRASGVLPASSAQNFATHVQKLPKHVYHAIYKNANSLA